MLVRAIRRLLRELHARRDPTGYARSLGVRVGDGCWFIETSAATWGSEPYLVTIGDRVLITEQVRFVTHDGVVWLDAAANPRRDRIAPITVGSDVFIGLRAIIMPGVRIGNRCAVAAGAVVTRDVADGTLVAGVPAREVGTLDEYWVRHAAEFRETRHLPPDEKRRVLLQEWSRDA